MSELSERLSDLYKNGPTRLWRDDVRRASDLLASLSPANSEVDLVRVWELMDPYLRKLYREAASLNIDGARIDVWPGDDRDGVVAVIFGDWLIVTRIALSREEGWYDDDHDWSWPPPDDPDNTWIGPSYYQTLQEAWDALGKKRTCPTCGSNDPMVFGDLCLELGQQVGGRALVDSFHPKGAGA